MDSPAWNERIHINFLSKIGFIAAVCKAEAYEEPNRTSKMEFFQKIIND